MGDRGADGDAADTGADTAEPSPRRAVEISADTADLLAARAAALGISVGELIALLAGEAAAPPQSPVATQRAAQAEPSEARWRDVKAWIDSWGKPDERPRPKLGK